MKTTIEIPDPLFRRAKARAAERGQSLKDFFIEALNEKLAINQMNRIPSRPEWMRGFGQLRRLKRETARVMSRIDGAFEVVEPEDEL